MSSTTILTENMSRLWSSVLARELALQGVEHIFMAPGMRNAPLIAGFQAQENITVHVGMDERALAYQALGFSKMTGKVAVLACTSGTAAANFYPAVIEAHKAHIPLLVISADRPLELSQTDANQTINQRELYGHFAKHFVELGTPNADFSLRALGRLVTHAYESALRAPMGPVQINISFREPLDGKSAPIESNVLKQVEELRKSNVPLRQTFFNSAVDINGIKSMLDHAKRPLLILGDMAPHLVAKTREELIPLLKRCPYLLNVDVTSSLKFDFALDDGVVPTFDHPEVYDYFHQNPPDIIVHFGARLTSKHYYRFLNEHPGHFPVVHVSENLELSDSGHAVTHNFVADPLRALVALAHNWPSSEKINSPFAPFIAKKIDVIEQSDKLAFPYLSKRIIEMIPTAGTLVIGNSTLIRSFDSYAAIHEAKAIDVLTHRGVSGIEGFFASSSGAALATNKAITLALGDVSALHDLNSLELIARSETPIICIVVNNYGGGIFTLLNLHKGEELYPIITSPHERKLAPIAEAFGLKTFSVDTRQEFEDAYKEALKLNQSSFIEIFVDNSANNAIYQQLKTIKLP